MKYVQLSLFENDFRSVSDETLVAELTKGKADVDDVMESCYGMEKLFNSLAPKQRKVAEAVIELYKRREIKKRDAAGVRSSQDIYNIMQPLLSDLPNEEFWVVMLSNSCKLIKKMRISVGGIDGTCADTRLIMRALIEAGAVQFAIVHNHPSGSRTPSRADDLVTKKIRDAATLFDIHMLDHVIVAGGTYYSFSDEGRL